MVYLTDEEYAEIFGEASKACSDNFGQDDVNYPETETAIIAELVRHKLELKKRG